MHTEIESRVVFAVNENVRSQLSFRWPRHLPLESFAEEGFIGAWHPSQALQVSVAAPSPDVAHAASRNWFLLSSTSPLHPRPNGLVHRWIDQASGQEQAVAFRGYVLQPPLHSWSSSRQIAEYWEQNHTEHNGVFSAVRVGDDGEWIELITDAFGIAPLYYRFWNEVLLFATSPRLLAVAGDVPDLLAIRNLIETGYLCGNFSLTKGVQRAAAGHVLRFTAEGQSARAWFDLAALPGACERISSQGLREIEDTFQMAMTRCLRLPAARNILPLSSGYDSRRILAALCSRRVPFEARTVRVLNKDVHDLDAHWTGVMAREMGFPHTILETPSLPEFVADDRLRRALTDSELVEHTWMMQLARTLPNESALVFDGLGGDIFNNTGYGAKEYFTASDDEKLALIANKLVPGHCTANLKETRWPTAAALRESIVEFLSGLPRGNLRADLAFLLLRARRGTGVWSQTMLPAGHVPVYPYFDLDYVRVTFRFDPLDKVERFFQDRLLAEFSPEFYKYPGTRRIPPDTKTADPSLLISSRIAALQELFTEFGDTFSGSGLLPWVSTRGGLVAILARHNDKTAIRAHWWLYPLLSAMARHRSLSPCWAVAHHETTAVDRDH